MFALIIINNRNTISLEAKNNIYTAIAFDKTITGNCASFEDTSKNIYLFARNVNNSPLNYASFKLYSMQIYANDKLERDYIPVIDENGVACLYDKVEGKFYYNQGTGDFKTNLDE